MSGPFDDEANDFRECAACAAKPGSPILCASCYHNRGVIFRLVAAARFYEGASAEATPDAMAAALALCDGLGLFISEPGDVETAAMHLTRFAATAVAGHQSEPNANDPDGWVRRSALNHWRDRAVKAESGRGCPVCASPACSELCPRLGGLEPVPSAAVREWRAHHANSRRCLMRDLENRGWSDAAAVLREAEGSAAGGAPAGDGKGVGDGR